MDQDAELRRITVAVYRAEAVRLHMQAALLGAQAEAFEDAAARIESGAVEPDTLRLAVADDVPPAPATEEDAKREKWEAQNRRLLRAVVEASKQPVSQLEEATAIRIMEEAGVDRRDEAEAKHGLETLAGAGLIEMHRLAGPGPRPMVVFVPTREGFAEVDAAAPALALAHEETTVFEHVAQETREIPVVGTEHARGGSR